MAKSKKLIMMAVGILLLIAAVIGVMKYNEYRASQEPEESSGSVVLKDLWNNEKSNMVSVNLTTQKDSITLVPGEVDPGTNMLTWHLEDHPHWELTHTYQSLVSMATVFQVYKEIETNVSDSRLADFGLAEPVAVLTVTLKDGSMQRVSIGNLSSDQDYAFCIMDGDPTVYACDANYYSYASFTKDSIRLATMTELNTKAQLYSLFVQKKGERPVEVHYKDELDEQKETSETSEIISKYTFVQPYSNPHIEVIQAIDSDYFANLTTPEILETIEVNCTDFDQYGLGDEPEYRETIVTRTANADQTAYEYQTTDYLFGYTYDKGGVKCIYFREAGSDLVLGVRADCMDVRRFEPFYYVNKLVYLKNITQVQEGTITVGEETHSFNIKRSAATEEDTLSVYRFDDELIDADTFLTMFRIFISIAPDYEILNEVPEYDETDKVEFKVVNTDGTEEVITYYRLSEFYYVTQMEDGIWFACGDTYIDRFVEKLEACKQAVSQAE